MNIFQKWFQALPLAIGFFLSIGSVLFMVKFVRGIELSELSYVFQYPIEYFPSLGASLVLSLVGIPLVYNGLEKLEKN